MHLGISLDIGSILFQSNAADARIGLNQPGVVLYLESGAGMTNDGAEISQWANRANAAAPAISITAPAYEAAGFNGHPSASFVKANTEQMACDAVGVAASGNAVPYLLCAALQWPVTPANTDCAFSFGRGATGTPIDLLRALTGPVWNTTRRNDAGTVSATSSVALIDTDIHVVTWIYTGTTRTLRVDGVALIDAAADTADGVTTLDRFGIGCGRDNIPGQFSNIRLAELCVIVGNVPDAAVIEAIETDIGRLLL